MKRIGLAVLIAVVLVAGWWLTSPLSKAPPSALAPTPPRPVLVTPATPRPPLALVVRLIDAETGAPVQGGAVQAAARAGHRESEEARIALPSDGDVFRLSDAHLRRGVWATFWADVYPPSGYLRVNDRVEATLSCLADVVEWTIPLRRELDLEIRPIERFANSDTTVKTVVVAGASRPFEAGPVVERRIVVRGVPFVRSAQVRACVKSTRLEYAEARMGIERSGLGYPEARLGALPGLPCRLAFEGVTEQDLSDIRVVDSGFYSIQDDETDSESDESSTDDAAVEDRRREAEGVASTITAVDETGRPLPCVAVWIRGTFTWEHVQDEGGIQQLVLRTDSAGRCRVHGLERGRRTGQLTWDTRSVPIEFTAGEGLSVTLPPPEE